MTTRNLKSLRINTTLACDCDVCHGDGYLEYEQGRTGDEYATFELCECQEDYNDVDE